MVTDKPRRAVRCLLGPGHGSKQRCDTAARVHRLCVLATTSRPSVPGIGKSLAQRLAQQGLNVVLVALDVRVH